MNSHILYISLSIVSVSLMHHTHAMDAFLPAPGAYVAHTSAWQISVEKLPGAVVATARRTLGTGTETIIVSCDSDGCYDIRTSRFDPAAAECGWAPKAASFEPDQTTLALLKARAACATK